MKMDRLIGILSILLQREQVTAPELAEQFEVSRRTIQRDIEALCRAGIPITTAQAAGPALRETEVAMASHPDYVEYVVNSCAVPEASVPAKCSENTACSVTGLSSPSSAMTSCLSKSLHKEKQPSPACRRPRPMKEPAIPL